MKDYMTSEIQLAVPDFARDFIAALAWWVIVLRFIISVLKYSAARATADYIHLETVVTLLYSRMKRATYYSTAEFGHHILLVANNSPEHFHTRRFVCLKQNMLRVFLFHDYSELHYRNS